MSKTVLFQIIQLSICTQLKCKRRVVIAHDNNIEPYGLQRYYTIRLFQVQRFDDGDDAKDGWLGFMAYQLL